MAITVFSLFKAEPYVYRKLERGTVRGVRVVYEKECEGIVKQRNSLATNQMEDRAATMSIHAHPEDIDDVNNVVGDGVVYDGVSYDIIGMSVGKNFLTGKTEHITLNLERAEHV